jgi:hypothetical protein
MLLFGSHLASNEEGQQRVGVLFSIPIPGSAAPKLIVVYSPDRKLYGPLKQVVTDLQRAHPGRDLAVIVPELVATRWYHYLLHNQTAAFIKGYLLFSGFRRMVVINVPWYLSP